MSENNARRKYMKIETMRLLDIRVFLDGNMVFEGVVKNPPVEIKELNYSEVEMKDKVILKCYSY